MNRPDFIDQPHQLQPTEHHRHDRRRRRELHKPRRPGPRRRQHPIRGRRLLQPAIQTQLPGLDLAAKRAKPTARASPRSSPYPAALGTQANIKEVKVDLPKQLPSRLTTLQKACTAATVQHQPGRMPSGVEHRLRQGDHPDPARPARRPRVLRLPRRRSIPQPHRSSSRATASGSTSPPQHSSAKPGSPAARSTRSPTNPSPASKSPCHEGPYTALAANGNLCTPTKTVTTTKTVKEKVHGSQEDRRPQDHQAGSPECLAMPTAFVGQNGAEIHESTPVTVTGCPKAKPAKKARKRQKRKKR